MSTVANRAVARMNAFGKKYPKTVSGTVVLADTNPVTITTGLREVTQAVCTVVGATPAATAVTKNSPKPGDITVEAAAANTVDWIASGY